MIESHSEQVVDVVESFFVLVQFKCQNGLENKDKIQINAFMKAFRLASSNLHVEIERSILGLDKVASFHNLFHQLDVALNEKFICQNDCLVCDECV